MIFYAVSGQPVCLGFVGENEVEAVVFDKSAWLTEYGPGTFELVHQRRQDTDPLPVAVDVDDGVITWTLTESDTAYRGRGECQLSFYTPDGKLKKSEIYQTFTARSLTSAEDPPSPAQGWVAEVLAAAAGIQNMQVGAETNLPGTPATVVKTVDPDTGVVTLTFGIPEGLKGDTGRGIASMSVLSTGEWRVTYTDGTSETVGYDVYSAIEALKAAAQEAAETASDKATEAASSARNAEQDADRAEQGAEDAQAAKTAAQQAKTDAETAKTDAETAARNAEQDADRAEQGADRAEQGAEDAQQAKTDAEAAKTDAETAARNAEEWASQVDPDNLAHIDGYYPDMTVGNAEQLVSTLFVEDTEPYTFRKAGGSHDIGNREYDEIVGGSLAWNQLVQNGDFAEGTTGWLGTSASLSASGGVLTVTKNENASQGTGYAKQTGVKLTVGHKYLFTCEYKGIAGKQLSLYTNGTGAGRTNVVPEDENWHRNERVIEVTLIPNTTCMFWLNYNTTTDDNVAQFRNICYFDLTLMFGTVVADYVYSLEQANAGAGVAWFRRYFPNDYYAYSPGSMESVQVSAHKTVGFNAYNPATGTAKVLGNMTYQITGAYTALAIDGAAITPDTDGIFTPSKNGELTVTGGDSMTTCVHLVHSGYRNGEYEPYVEHVYPLDSSLTLRGVPTLDNDKLKFNGDVYASDGTVTRRYGIVDLGTLNWNYTTSGIADGAIFYALYNVATMPMLCAKYPYANAVGGNSGAFNKGDKTLSRISNGTRIYIRDDAYTDATTFRAAMQGVMLVYGLPEPTTETADPFQSPQIVDDFGTEEYVDAALAAETRDFAFPVGHDTKYPSNLRDKLQHLPSPAAENGRYVIRQTNKDMTLVPDTSPGQLAALAVRVPNPPTTDGTYRLTVTVTDGTPAYSWVQA